MRAHALTRAVLLTLGFTACPRPPAPAAPPAAPYDPAAGPDARRIEADVRFLADDLLEGREAGTRGYDLASLYVAQRLRAIGLRPAGDDGGYYQTVPMLRATRIDGGGRLAIVRDGATTELRFGDDYLPGLNYDNADASVDAPAVFVAQGVVAPELQQDDYAGLDVKGKVAVMFYGAPPRFDNDRRAFYSSTAEKLRAAVERGAVGVVFVHTAEEDERYPWTRVAQGWNKPGMRLRGDDGKGIDTFPQLRVVATTSSASAQALLGGEGRTAAQLFQAAQDGKLKGFALPGTLALAAKTPIEPMQSRNVVAAVDGSHATLARQNIVFTAHLDHMGIGAPVNGDAIYNGALDNALGIAVMLETANRLVHATDKPKRSLLFVAVTAEERGLLGAEWFAQHPTVPRESLVANINMDMPMLLAPSKDVVPIGLEHSSLQPLVKQAAGDVGVSLSADPSPEEAVFIRSDQYAFIRTGVPAVYLDAGIVAAGDGDPKAARVEFLRQRYHQPNDDVSQPIQYGDAARLARLNARIGQLVADTPQAPAWNAGDFFGDRFAPKAK
mgnify:FL=1